MVLNPQTDDLGSRFFTGGKNPKPKKDESKRRNDEPPVHYTELDAAHWRIQEIYHQGEFGCE